MNLKKLLADASPGKWRIRELRIDFFVEADKLEKTDGFNIEVLGDEEYPTKRADAELIVALQNMLLEESEKPSDIEHFRNNLLDIPKELLTALKELIYTDPWINANIKPVSEHYVVSVESDEGPYVTDMEFDGKNWLYNGAPLFSQTSYMEVMFYRTIKPKIVEKNDGDEDTPPFKIEKVHVTSEGKRKIKDVKKYDGE